MLKITVTTSIFFTVPVRLAFYRVDMVTTGTSLRSISRWNKNNRDTSNICFVFGKPPQLVKCPIVSPASFFFAPWLLIQRLSDICQVFKCKRSITAFRIFDQLFRNVVICRKAARKCYEPLLESLFSPREPSQQSSRTASAFGLNIGPDLTVSVASSLNLFTTPRFTSRSCCNVAPTQINADYFWCFTSRFGREVNTNIDVVTVILSMMLI